jgi:hypothetical protein
MMQHMQVVLLQLALHQVEIDSLLISKERRSFTLLYSYHSLVSF